MNRTCRLASAAFIFTGAIFIAAIFVSAQERISPSLSSLCQLQKAAVEGGRESVRVSGIFVEGFEHGVLTDPSCGIGSETWVELDLRSERSKEKLRQLMTTVGKAKVIFVGEFFGPAVPDEKLPPAIKANYHPGWGHLSAFRTKIVVSEIESVIPASSPVSIPDTATAISVAEKALAKIYGKDKINTEKPFKAVLSDGVWHVWGTLYCKDENGKLITDACVGGVASADIRQSDGKILRTGHTK